MKTIGMIIVLVGLGLTIFTAISYFTQETILKIGTVELMQSQPHSLNWSPFIGMAIMVVGAFLILRARKKQ